MDKVLGWAAVKALFVGLAPARKNTNAEHLLEDALETSHRGLVFFDAQDRSLLANRTAQKIMPVLCQKKGVPLSDFLNFIFDKAIECDESLSNVLDKLVPSRGGTTFREVIQIQNVIYVAKVMKAASGRTVLALVDVSDFKKHEDLFISLHDMSHDLAQAVEATTNGIVLARENKGDFEICFANQAFRNLLKVAIPDILGHDVLTFLKPMLSLPTYQKIDQALERGLSVEAEFSMQNGAGPSWRSLQLTKVRARSGAADMFIGVLADITESRLREQSAFQLQKMEALGQLAAGVAHDFNNLLSLIDGHARAAEQGLQAHTDPPAIVESIGKVRTAVDRGAGLIRQMLTFSRHQIVSDSIMNLGESLADQAKMLQPLLTSAVEMKLDLTEEKLCVHGAENALVQILMNLVVNARDAMPQGGRVTISLEKASPAVVDEFFSDTVRSSRQNDAGYALLCVRDTGTGIPADILPRVFEPFFTSKSAGKGTGLGLYVVYGLVKQMGGAIDVRSQVGTGTEFRILLPLTDESGQVRKLSGAVSDPLSLRFDGYTVLLAEDEPGLLELMGDDLTKVGFHVLRAEDGDTALVVQDEYEGQIDILLTDIVMPRLSGIKLAAMVQSERPDIGLVFMSGYPRAASDDGDLPPEAVYLSKPLRLEALLPVLRNVLDARKSALLHPDTLNASRWEIRHGTTS